MNKLTDKEYKSVLVEMLVQVDELCRKHDIKYLLFYGSLLGAVRHKGFIPWDDDIDIVVMRKDYYRLKKIIRESKTNLSFICPESNEDTIFPFGKVCNSDTVLYEKNFRDVQGYGAYIDVFPFDYLPNDEKKRKRLMRRYSLLERINLHAARTGYEKVKSRKANLMKWFAFTCARVLDPTKLTKWMNKKFKQLSLQETDYIGLPWGYTFYSSKIFENRIEIQFENQKVWAPIDMDSVLTQLYGDYMELPPEEERVSNHMFSCCWKNDRDVK